MLIGKTFGRFTIDRELGAGAMGSVFRAKDAKTGDWVAIKVIADAHSSNDTAKQRFEREFEILKQLKHPNIVRLIAAGRLGKTPFYAMEYVEGESLDKVMARRGRIDWEEVIRLGQQLCAGLQHAHEKGIVHRDLKPSNLMILKDGTVKLTDFGIAKDLDRTAITEANCTVGTAAYMSPEQCKGDRNLTSKSDLYSMGVMFYELLTGKKPFEADSALDMFMQHVKGKFERPSRLALEVPIFLDTLVCQLMEKEPERRPYSAALVSEALGRVREKVSAQQAAGLDAVRTLNRDKPPDTATVDATDKEAVNALLGKKKKKRRREAFYRQTWFKAALLSLGLAGIAAFLFLFVFVKPSADWLYQSAEQAMASNDADVRLAARKKGGPIADYLAYYGDRDDTQSRKIRKWADEVDADTFERLLVGRLRDGRNVGVDDDEQAFRQALAAEEAGDPPSAQAIWAKLAKYTDEPQQPEPSDRRSCGLVAQGRLLTLEDVSKREKRLEKGVTKSGFVKGFSPADDNEKKAAEAFKLELEKSPKATRAWQDFQKQFDRDATATRAWWLLAAKRLHALAQEPPKKTPLF